MVALALHDYSQLNDEQIRSAIRFAEKRLRWAQEEHVELTRAYRGEIDAMRRHLFDRILTRIITSAAPLSNEQRDDLRRAFERRALNSHDVAHLIRATSRGRTTQVDALTEIEAMALLMRLERRARNPKPPASPAEDYAIMAYDNQLDWLRDRGVQIDRKGRVIVRLPAIPDADAYDRNLDDEDREPTIAELMRRDVNVRQGGSRGRRRRGRSKPAQSSRYAAQAREPAPSARIGRPVIGSEVRVYVQTSIAQRTREMLAKHGVTLADVFDDYVRQLPDAS